MDFGWRMSPLKHQGSYPEKLYRSQNPVSKRTFRSNTDWRAQEEVKHSEDFRDRLEEYFSVAL